MRNASNLDGSQGAITITAKMSPTPSKEMAMHLLQLSAVRLTIAALSALTAVISLTSTATAATASSSAGKTCPSLTVSGTKYEITVFQGYKCNKAETYIPKLVTSKVGKGSPPRVKGGPSGWHCFGAAIRNGLALSGTCKKKVGLVYPPGPSFDWTS